MCPIIGTPIIKAKGCEPAGAWREISNAGCIKFWRRWKRVFQAEGRAYTKISKKERILAFLFVCFFFPGTEGRPLTAGVQ